MSDEMTEDQKQALFNLLNAEMTLWIEQFWDSVSVTGDPKADLPQPLLSISDLIRNDGAQVTR